MPPPEIVPSALVRRVLLSSHALASPHAWSVPRSNAATTRSRSDRQVAGRPRSSAAAVAALVEQLGYVQIDSINVVDRAHHLILSARLDGFRPTHLASALEQERSLFEHWTHDACAIPSRWYPHWHHRFKRFATKDRAHAWWRERFGSNPDRVMRAVLKRVRDEGPLRARDFVRAEGSPAQPGNWWNWHPEKAALEHLWRSGRLAVAARQRFEKVYDLAERVHPVLHAAEPTDEGEHLDWLCRSALERLGFATERELAAFWSAARIEQVRGWTKAAAARGEIERVQIMPDAGGVPVAAVTLAGWRERWTPMLDALEATPVRRARGVAARNQSGAGLEMIALAPFDPVIRDRARTLRLFGFDYRFEAFTPAPKRRFGYYTMPLLEGERLVGRVDPKFDRSAGTLLVRGPWWEEGIRPDRARRERLDAALSHLALRVGAERWRPSEP